MFRWVSGLSVCWKGFGGRTWASVSSSGTEAFLKSFSASFSVEARYLFLGYWNEEGRRNRRPLLLEIGEGRGIEGSEAWRRSVPCFLLLTPWRRCSGWWEPGRVSLEKVAIEKSQMSILKKMPAGRALACRDTFIFPRVRAIPSTFNRPPKVVAAFFKTVTTTTASPQSPPPTNQAAVPTNPPLSDTTTNNLSPPRPPPKKRQK